jgi:hypothetical protein
MLDVTLNLIPDGLLIVFITFPSHPSVIGVVFPLAWYLDSDGSMLLLFDMSYMQVDIMYKLELCAVYSIGCLI